MKALLIGADNRIEELKQKFANFSNIEIEIGVNAEDEDYSEYDVIIDLNFDDDPSGLEFYAQLKNKPVIVSCAKQQLAETAYLYGERIHCMLIGLNALPTFINRPKWEVSLLHTPQKSKATDFLNELGVEHHWVEDRVGMVTPRIIFMIINEACYTLQEGTASIEDIDLGMKLGTNYPKGPFEWADAIGITDVFETLAALYEDTKEERYKICPLLKTKYLKNQRFYKS